MALAIEGADSFPSGLAFFNYKNKRHFFCELTAEGIIAGEIPASLRSATPEIFVAPAAAKPAP